jgi:hypothetical protein
MKKKFILLFISFSNLLYAQQKERRIELGLDNRFMSIDVEDVPRGPITSNGGFYGEAFYETNSIMAKYGNNLTKRLSFYFSAYARYNHLNWKKGYNYSLPHYEREEVKSMKYDLFFDLSWSLNRMPSTKYFFVDAGLGFTNLNSKYQVYLRDTNPTGSIGAGRLYKGDLIHFGPRVLAGYFYKNIKLQSGVYFIENSELSNLLSVWPTLSLSYSFKLPMRKNEKL